MSVFFLNIFSLRNKLDELKAFNRLGGAYDCIILNEIHLKSHEINKFGIEGYKEVFNCREEKKGGGTCVFVKEEFDVTVKEIGSEYNHIIIAINGLKSTLNLMTAYRPPSMIKSDLISFFKFLENTINKYDNLVCVGDFNINLLNKDIVTYNYIEIIQSFGFEIKNVIEIDQATRTTQNTATLID